MAYPYFMTNAYTFRTDGFPPFQHNIILATNGQYPNEKTHQFNGCHKNGTNTHKSHKHYTHVTCIYTVCIHTYIHTYIYIYTYTVCVCIYIYIAAHYTVCTVSMLKWSEAKKIMKFQQCDPIIGSYQFNSYQPNIHCTHAVVNLRSCLILATGHQTWLAGNPCVNL